MNIDVSKTVHKILDASCDEALRTGYMATSADHIMLALLRHGNNSACRVLSELGVDLVEFKQYIDDKIFRSKSISFDELPKIRPGKQAMATIKNAIYEAYKEHQEVGCLHLLLGICRTMGSVSAEFLNETGVDYDRILGYCAQIKLETKNFKDITPALMRSLEEQLSVIFSGSAEMLAS